MLEPPPIAPRDESVKRLRGNGDILLDAFERMTPERCGQECVQLPFGVFSLYEIGEFVAAHVVRHTG